MNVTNAQLNYLQKQKLSQKAVYCRNKSTQTKLIQLGLLEKIPCRLCENCKSNLTCIMPNYYLTKKGLDYIHTL